MRVLTIGLQAVYLAIFLIAMWLSRPYTVPVGAFARLDWAHRLCWLLLAVAVAQTVTCVLSPAPAAAALGPALQAVLAAILTTVARCRLSTYVQFARLFIARQRMRLALGGHGRVVPVQMRRRPGR